MLKINRPFAHTFHWLGTFSGFIVAVVVLIAYSPSLYIGFWMDDYIAIDFAGRLSGLDYLLKYFDPRVQRLWYRPMVGMQWGLEYLFFRADPFSCHVVQVLYHFVNSLLLFVLTTRVTRRRNVGLIAALVYSTLPLSSMSVYWTSVHDPLAGVFYLLTILLWLGYAKSGSRVKFALAFAAFLGALLSKEVSVTLPIMLFLADRLLVNKPVHFADLVKRYSLFVAPLAVYAWFQRIVITGSEFTQQIGYRIGEDTMYAFTKFLSLLAFPWELKEPFNYVWLMGTTVLFLFFLFTRERKLLFLGAAAVLPTMIAAPIPLHLFNPRYLYLPLMASAVGYGLLCELMLDRARRWRWRIIVQAALGAGVTFVIIIGSTTIAEYTENFGGFIRQVRMSFRPIYQQYPMFPPDTFLYFIDAPLQTLDISGLMFLRYGAQVTVGGVDRGSVSNLRDHNAAFVWYLDDQGQFRAQAVAKKIHTHIVPPLSMQFGNAIALDTLEIVSDHVKPGEAAVVLMRWKALGAIDKDYTVFVHLVNEKGEIVAGSDSQPRKGLAPTTLWRVGNILADGMVVPLPDQVEPGQKYSLEVGWYHQPTMERLHIVNSTGHPIADKIVIGPLIVE